MARRGGGVVRLRDPRITPMVADAFPFFEGERYELLAWCIMPNHAHTVLRPIPPHELSKILMSWKGFTGKEANKILGCAGTFWQKESYDHIVRDQDDLCRQITYVLDTPRKAGLKDWPWVWASAAAFRAVGRLT